MGKILGLDVQPQLQTTDAAHLCYKRPDPIQFRIATETELIHTNEGDVTAQPGDAIMTALSGKQWPIPGHKFAQTYEDKGDGTASKKMLLAYAKQLQTPIQVAVSWADEPINGNVGDYLVQGGEDDYWIVEKQEFLDTYICPTY